ncbi:MULTISPECIES: hypothetical protein [unclassified Frankia]|uniref:hypothetical protein n=1 Tax=unclassified Frankia TaxID=2632575 RepID=UPI002AD29660|nr:MULTISPECIES: hypothetical protein [unclassified Frankia]
MSTTFQISPEDVHRALDDLDPLALVVAELTGRKNPEGSLVVGPVAGAGVGLSEKHIAVEDPRGAVRFLLPLRALQAVRSACLAGAAARLFVPPGAATVSVLGSGLSAEMLLRMAARYVDGVSHVAVCAVGGSSEEIVTHRVVDELDLSGISFIVTSEIAEAAFGANFVGIAGKSAVDLHIGQIAKGAVLVNCSGWDLPIGVVNGVATVYVDNLGLIEENLHRHFVRAHRSSETGTVARRHREYRSHRIAGDLRGLLSGDHVARSKPPEGILLVEVLSVGLLSTSLACQLTLAAHRLGLGNAIPY